MCAFRVRIENRAKASPDIARSQSPGCRAELPATPAGHPTIRVLVVDDHAVLRQELIRILRREPDIEIVGEAADGKLAVDLVGELRPDIVTMDVSMPVMDGIEATRQIRAAWPTVRVIGLSMFNSAEYASVMAEAGAIAYLVKGTAADLLVAAIRESKHPNA